MIDLAYQGFGDGLEADVAGLRHMAAAVPEMMLAASCSKNFGLYRDRVGAAFVALRRPGAGRGRTNRTSPRSTGSTISFPPDHGAKVVATDPRRPRAQGRLDGRARGDAPAACSTLRKGLADALRRATNSDRFDFVAAHRGMFSRLGASPEQVAALRKDHGIYMVGDSRVNIAGLPADGLDKLARAIARRRAPDAPATLPERSLDVAPRGVPSTARVRRSMRPPGWRDDHAGSPSRAPAPPGSSAYLRQLAAALRPGSPPPGRPPLKLSPAAVVSTTRARRRKRRQRPGRPERHRPAGAALQRPAPHPGGPEPRQHPGLVLAVERHLVVERRQPDVAQRPVRRRPPAAPFRRPARAAAGSSNRTPPARPPPGTRAGTPPAPPAPPAPAPPA